MKNKTNANLVMNINANGNVREENSSSYKQTLVRSRNHVTGQRSLMKKDESIEDQDTKFGTWVGFEVN